METNLCINGQKKCGSKLYEDIFKDTNFGRFGTCMRCMHNTTRFTALLLRVNVRVRRSYTNKMRKCAVNKRRNDSFLRSKIAYGINERCVNQGTSHF